MATPPRAGIYVRISDDREGRGLGVERQEEDCRALAKRLKWQVHDVYSDNDISASRFGRKRRPDYERLLEDLEAGVINAVLAYHPSRLHRRPLELERYIDISGDRPTHTCRAGRWDLSTPSGRLQARIMANVDAYESEHKSDLVKRQRIQRAKNGKAKPGGARPYGFEKDGVTLRPQEAVEVIKAIEAVATGQSLRSLVRDLNEREVPTASHDSKQRVKRLEKAGKPVGRVQWTSATLRDIVMRPRNAGLVAYQVEAEDDDGNTVTKTEYAKAVWDPLVPAETWRGACDILMDAERTTTTNGSKRGGTVKWLGSGLYVCGVCEQPHLRVTGMSEGKKRPRKPRRLYRCADRADVKGTAHVNREAYGLDRYVEALLVARISDPRVLKKLRETPADTVDTRALRAELSALGKREDTLGRNYATGKITERVMNGGMEEISARKAEIDAALERVGQRTPLDPFRKAKDAKDVARIWYGPGGVDGDRTGGLSLGARRAILGQLLTITVNPHPKRVPRHPDGSYLDRDSIGIAWK